MSLSVFIHFKMCGCTSTPVCIHVCMCVCIHLYLCVYIYVCMCNHQCMHVCTYVLAYVCMYVCIQTYVCTSIYACIHRLVYVCSGALRRAQIMSSSGHDVIVYVAVVNHDNHGSSENPQAPLK